VVPKLAQHVAGWTPINEYNLLGGMPPSPEKHRDVAELKLNLLRADGRAYDAIKAHSAAPIGSTVAFAVMNPQRKHDTLDNIMTRYSEWVSWGFYFHAIRTGEWQFPFSPSEYLPEVKGRADIWAVNIYTRNMVDSRSADIHGKRYVHSNLPLIDMEFYLDEWVPDELMHSLDLLKDKPVYITENGVSAKDDRFRIAYMALHYAAFKQAIDHGVDLRGLFHWSLMDNYEWGSYLPTFGLVACDRKTFQRTPKPSAAFYRDIIERNGLSGDLVRTYLDHLPSKRNGRH
jgi:beta-glucosidase